MNSEIVTLDVREEFRSGKSPCDKVKNALGAVDAGQSLRLLVPFEPVPLFDLAGKQGLGHSSSQTSEGDWEILFFKDATAAATATKEGSAKAAACGCSGPPAPRDGRAPAVADIVEVDARGLEPPQPMVKILEALATLPPEAELQARTDRRPVHLYARLEERSYVAESQEQADGSYVTHIRHR
jgi:uncharacterized protein (DUF2249 family)